MGANQVVRSAGFSLGSTLGALILAAYTLAGAVFPASQGYAAASWAGAASPPSRSSSVSPCRDRP